MRAPGEDEVRLNPSLDAEIAPDSTLFYIAVARIRRIDWDFAGAV